MYGKHAVVAAMQNPFRKIYKIYCTQRIYEKYSLLIQKFQFEIKDNGFISQILKHDNHQGIIANLKTIYHKKFIASECKKEKFIVILDQMQDSQNIGAIIRSANAFNIRHFITTIHNTPCENGLLARAAAGCLEYSQIYMIPNVNQILHILKKLGFWVVGLSNESSFDKLSDIVNIEKLVLVIGSESNGIRPLVLKNCDFRVRIPISSKIESLNASNAASIAFYHFSKSLFQ
ncbi:MAG: 23S rRNA (guanosine(2251)-2'-O)-methyltransferase RlmB [Rickettsia sp.]|nr:23S rRNA (guanosine(2251)-2'-O)-methyltransferase RlmB [Rickettsia sp.]